MPKEIEKKKEETKKSKKESKGQDFFGLEKEITEESSQEDESLTTQENSERRETNFEPIKNIGNIQFHEFLQPSTESGAPVLERVTRTPEQVNLEQGLDFTQTSIEEPDEKPMDYSLTSNAPDYFAKTIEREEVKTYEPPILRPLNISKNLPRQELLNPLESMRTNPQSNIQLKKVASEFREETRKLPFETRDERKYREVRL